jgi:hypothetical protein
MSTGRQLTAAEVPVDGKLPIVLPKPDRCHLPNVSLVLAAYHEAGHAIAAITLRMPVGRAKIAVDLAASRGGTPSGNVLLTGWPAFHYAETDHERQVLRYYAIINAAGLIAGERSDIEALNHTRPIHETECCRIVRWMRPGMTVPDIMAEMKIAMADATALIDAMWPAVSQLARLLLRDREVSGREMCALVRDLLCTDHAMRASAETITPGLGECSRISQFRNEPGYLLDPPRGGLA